MLTFTFSPLVHSIRCRRSDFKPGPPPLITSPTEIIGEMIRREICAEPALTENEKGENKRRGKLPQNTV
jgi:hypothetical protein